MSSTTRIKVKGLGRVRPPRLDGGELQKIGEALVRSQKERWASGVNASGSRAKPLNKGYLFKKQKLTGVHRPKRDNKLTGLLVENFQLRKAIDGVIRAENTTVKARQHARQAEQYDEMIGFAPAEQVEALKLAQASYGRYLRKAWIQLS